MIKEEVESLSELIAETLEIGDEKIRVDSFMVASSSKKMSRILYSQCQFDKKLKQLDKKSIPESCPSYL